MKRIGSILCLITLLAATALQAQTESAAQESSLPNLRADKMTKSAARESGAGSLKPLSRIAISAGVSAMGVNLQAATNLNRFFNVRGVGNVLLYNIDNVSTNGFDVKGKINFASAGVAVDFYPFPNHGLRFSPGILLYNDNMITANGQVTPGKSIDLNGVSYYSAHTGNALYPTATPLNVNGSVLLNTRKNAFTATTGWGDMISRKGRHWSVPFEVGAAFVGAPKIDLGLTGWACQDAAQTQCANLQGNAAIAHEVQTNLDAEKAKWVKDTNPYKLYPILSIGISYNFRIR